VVVSSGDISRTIYAKWGYTIFVGEAGSYDLRFVSSALTIGCNAIMLATRPRPYAVGHRIVKVAFAYVSHQRDSRRLRRPQPM